MVKQIIMDWLPEIEEFKSYIEFERFSKYIFDRLEEEEIKEIQPKEYYFGYNPFGPNRDRWFIDCSSGDTWRLVLPDFPFKGFFEKVKYPLDRAVTEM